MQDLEWEAREVRKGNMIDAAWHSRQCNNNARLDLQVQCLSLLVVAFGSILGATAQTLPVTDNDILNFALQAECLAASFWNAAATGNNLTAAQLGMLQDHHTRKPYLGSPNNAL